MSEMPLISVITPSFNCGAYVRDCIESALAQNYDNFEHIIVDGASTDGTVEILKQYPHLKWISEPDKGEAEALNKALRVARGDIIGWLNADDYYLEGTFHRVVKEVDPQRNRHVIYGKTSFVREGGEFLSLHNPTVPVTLPCLLRFWKVSLWQPSMFYSRELVRDIGFYREGLYFSIDYDYWLRIAVRGFQFHFVDEVFASARIERPNAKSSDTTDAPNKSWFETSLLYHKHMNFLERVRWWIEYFSSDQKSKSKDWYNLAVEHWRLGNRWLAQLYILVSMLLFPPNLFNRNHQSIFLRSLIGDRLFEKAKVLLSVLYQKR